MNQKLRFPRSLLLLILALVLWGCSDDATDSSADQGSDASADVGADASEETPGEDACIHLTGGPFDSATAVTSLMDDLEGLPDDHTAYAITLADLGGGDFGGLVEYVADADAEVYFFFDTEASLEVRDAAGDPVSAEDSGLGDSACSDVGSWYVFDLEVGTYALDLGPTTESEVTLVHFEAGGHGHDERQE